MFLNISGKRHCTIRSTILLAAVTVLAIGSNIRDVSAETVPGLPENVLQVGGSPPGDNSCPLYVVTGKTLGSNDSVFTDIYKGGLSCLQTLAQHAIEICRPLVRAMHRDDLVDKCAVRGFFFHGYPDWDDDYAAAIARDPSIKRPTPNETHRCGGSGRCGTIYFDENCDSYPNPSASEKINACDGGILRAYMSPISLLWDENSKIDADLVLTSFPLDPSKSGASYIWKASAATPLLVYDPQHSGHIISADQLFGNWTFGGKRVAMLDGGAAHGATFGTTQWRDGFEALATLDQNSDGKVSGAELEPLALWFDANRDGISQDGEVKRLDAVGVLTLFYAPDSTDQVTGSIYASRGFERIENARKVTRPMVDWYGEVGRSRFELIAKNSALSFTTPAQGTAVSADPDDRGINQNGSGGSVTGAIPARKSANGAWEWETEDVKLAESDPQRGVLIFSENPADGTLTGHSMIELPYDKKSKRVKSAVIILSLSGTKETSPAGGITLHFKVQGSDRSVTDADASLLDDGTTIVGTSTAHIDNNGRKATLTYHWKAHRIGPPLD